MAFWIGLALFGAALYALWRLKDKDLAAAAAAVGLPRVPHSPGTQGTTPEGWACRDIVVAAGQLDGVRTSLLSRSIPKQFTPKAERVATQFTVITLDLATPPPATLRLQPVGWTRAIAAITHTPPPVVPTGDAEFDAVWHLHTDVPTAALLVLSDDLRRALVDFRNTHVPAGPAFAEGGHATLKLGSFEVSANRAVYSVFGSPTATTGAHVAGARPLLARLALSR